MGFFDFLKKKKESDSSIKPASEFYTDCVKEFHDSAMSLGVATRGLIYIPELIPIGEETVLEYLKDPFFKTEFPDPNTYYLVIMALCIDAGIDYALKWHEDFPSLKEYVLRIIRESSAPDAEKIMNTYLRQDLFCNQGNPFFAKIYPIWIKLHEPYWKLDDPREYTFVLMLAAYQLGVSIILEKFGY